MIVKLYKSRHGGLLAHFGSTDKYGHLYVDEEGTVKFLTAQEAKELNLNARRFTEAEPV